MTSIKSTLDASANIQDIYRIHQRQYDETGDPPSLHDETVVQRLRQSCFTFVNEDGLMGLYSKKEREDLEKVTVVKIPRSSEEVHLLRALPNLEEVTLNGSFRNFRGDDLATVLIGIAGLEKVKTLEISLCYDLTSVPPEIGQLIHLQTLKISNCSLTSVPPQIGQLIHLQTLKIHGCNLLTSLPHEIGQLIQLKKLQISSSSSLTSVPPEIGQLIQLQTLTIGGCDRLTSVPPEIGQLIQLQTLDISRCRSLTSVPPEIGQLIQLQILDISHCHSLTSVPLEIEQLIHLQKLQISNCDRLTSVPPEIGQLIQLQTLMIWNCSSLTSVHSLSPVSLRGLPPQCAFGIDGVIDYDFKKVCNAKGCNLLYRPFKRHGMNPYFDWLGNYPVGTMKLQMLANKALQRVMTAIYFPGGEEYKRLKICWEEMQEEDN